MKRRSARPFTVEIKNARTSRFSLTDVMGSTRTSQNIWGTEMIASANTAAEFQPTPVPRSEPERVEGPARRVLPSLVPIFAMPVEAEAFVVIKAPAEERLPRVRRVKRTANLTKALAMADAAKPVSDRAPAQQQAAHSNAVAIPEADATVVAQPAVARARSARRTQQAPTLRLGERWKRRLPRALW